MGDGYKKDGDVVLLTQADVDAFAAFGLSELNGSLTIGAATGQDSIYSLEGLEKLGKVKYDLIIHPTYAGADLAGLENLELIGSLQNRPEQETQNRGISQTTGYHAGINYQTEQIGNNAIHRVA